VTDQTASMNTDRLPSRLGYRMPAEWSPHLATWMAWPTSQETWDRHLPEVRQRFVEMIRILAAGETVKLLVDDRNTEEKVARLLRENSVADSQVRFYHLKTADAWIRDYGPNYLVSDRRQPGRRAMNDWDFNAWGDKYRELIPDGEIPRRIAEIDGVERFVPGIVLEGGSIDVNGRGICLTTKQCLLHPNRNPQLNRGQIEEFLGAFLGVRQFIWLEEGICGDDTDGHIDAIARFVAPDVLVCALEDDPRDVNYAPLKENYDRLADHPYVRDRIRIVPLPMPDPIEAPWGRLPASYANFYIANRSVLVPVFGTCKDELALDTLRPHFPGREIVGIRSESLVWGMGAVHCLTQQEPF